MNTVKSNKSYDTTFSVLLAVYPFISNYAMPGIPALGLNEFLMIVFSGFYVASKVRNPIIKVYKNGFFEFFFLYSIIGSLVIAIFIPLANFGDVFFRILRNCLQWFIVFFLAKELFNFLVFYEVYRIMATALSLFLIIQNIAFLGAGVVIPWLIPGLKLNYTISDPTEYMNHFVGKYYHLGTSIRATGGFTEPAAFTAYVLPVLALTLILLGNDSRIRGKRKYYIAVAAISSAVFLATSAIGILSMAAIYTVFFCKWSAKKGSKLKAFLVPIAFFSIVILGIYLVSTNAMIQSYMLRFEEIDLSAGASSGNQRVLRGIFVFLGLPFLMEIFGTGFGNISATLLSFNIHTPYDPEFGSNYMNGLSEVLVSTGIVGFAAFIMGLVVCVRKNWVNILELIVVFGCYMISANMLASASFVIYLVLITYFQTHKFWLPNNSTGEK